MYNIQNIAAFVSLTAFLIKGILVLRGLLKNSSLPQIFKLGIKKVKYSQSHLLELGIALLVSAILSLITASSFIVGDGGPITEPGSAVGIGISVVLIIVSTVAYYWYTGRTLYGIGICSSISLIFVLISPSGPLLFEPESEFRTVSWISIFTLIFLIQTVWIYISGDPFSSKLSTKQRGISLVGLGIISLFAITTMAFKHIKGVQGESENFPFTTEEKTTKIISKVDSIRINDFNAYVSYYQLFSEYSVRGKYFERNNEVKSAQLEIVVDLVDPVINTDDADKEKLDKIKFYQQAENRREKIFDSLLESFCSNKNRSMRVKLGYMNKRIKWIWPALKEKKINTSRLFMPGNTTWDRYDNLGQIRMLHSLTNNGEFYSRIYPAYLTQNTKSENHLSYQVRASKRIERKIEFKREKVENLYQGKLEDVIPKLKGNFHAQLNKQLTLENKDEQYLTFMEYRQIAWLDVDSIDRYGDQKNPVIAEFETLRSQNLSALREYFVINKNSHTIYMDVRELIFANRSSNKSLQALSEPLLDDQLIRLKTKRDNPHDYASPAVEKVFDAIQKVSDEGSRSRLLNMIIHQKDELFYDLFNMNVFQLIGTLRENIKNPTNEIKIICAEVDPLHIVIPLMAQRINLNVEGSFNTIFDSFADLLPKQRDIVLQTMAINIYEQRGQFGMTFHEFFLYRALNVKLILGFIVSSIYFLSVLLLLVFLSSVTSKWLMIRARLLEVMREEAKRFLSKHDYNLGTAGPLKGRLHSLNQLGNLANRGWGAIAVVGRRGVGKTRLLYEMMRMGVESGGFTLASWISSPTRVHEVDFIQSLLNNLLNNTEGKVGKLLDAQTIHERRIERKIAIKGISAFAVLFILFAVASGDAMRFAARDPLIIISIVAPGMLLAIVGLVLLIIYLIRLQPIDLSNWLDRERNANAHLVLLYRDIKDVRSKLNGSNRSNLKSNPWVWFFTVLLTVYFFREIYRWVIYLLQTENHEFFGVNEFLYIAFHVIAIVLIVWLLTKRRKVNSVKTESLSLFEVIELYRGFLETLVYRIKNGAFGNDNTSQKVLICVDELDKIINRNELKQFLVKIKSIFEIPGVYYYLSLSEDALQDLYFGPSVGKGEVDSSFDHVVEIDPLRLGESYEIAYSYLSIDDTDKSGFIEAVAIAVAAVSFGVARDIFRRCDEFKERQKNGNNEQLTSIEYLCWYLEKLVRLAWLTGHLDNSFYNVLGASKTFEDRMEFICKVLSEKETNSVDDDLLLLHIWVVCAITKRLLKNSDIDDVILVELNEFGYSISSSNAEYLLDKMKSLNSKILSDFNLNS